jgi:hypothetical protein
MFARPNPVPGARGRTPGPAPHHPVLTAANDHARSLGYTLIQLRPDARLVHSAPASPTLVVPPDPHHHAHDTEQRHQRPRLRRWLLVYLPLVLLVGTVLYVLCELAMKHLAVRSLHSQLLALPERPPVAPAATMLPPPAVPRPPAAPFFPTIELHSVSTNHGLQPMELNLRRGAEPSASTLPLF